MELVIFFGIHFYINWSIHSVLLYYYLPQLLLFCCSKLSNSLLSNWFLFTISITNPNIFFLLELYQSQLSEKQIWISTPLAFGKNYYSRLLNSSVSGIRVFCGDFRKMLRILNGIIVLCGHLQKFWGNLLTLWPLLLTFLRVIIVVLGNDEKINNSSHCNKLVFCGKFSKK